jgi:hypothetical protein
MKRTAGKTSSSSAVAMVRLGILISTLYRKVHEDARDFSMRGPGHLLKIGTDAP